jgi:prepilin-type N-terminal cleavage/methylation domain-containing protein
MKKGFTLIELVMAIVIAGIIVVPLLNIFINVSTKNPTLEPLGIALHLAEGKMESLINKEFGNITAESLTPFGADFSDYNSEVIIHYVASTELETYVDPATTDYKWLKVKVTSNDFSGTVEVVVLVTDVPYP